MDFPFDMDQETMKKKIVDLSNDELIALGLLGDEAPPDVAKTVEIIRLYPEGREDIDIKRLGMMCRKPVDPTPTPDPAETQYATIMNDPKAFTILPPRLITEFERQYYYHGVSTIPPLLIYRSDLESNPFPVPEPGTKLAALPTKTLGAASRSPLKRVWLDNVRVGPRVRDLITASGIDWSSLTVARFLTDSEDGDSTRTTRGPVVIWIGVRRATDPETLRDCTPNILKILEEVQIHDVVVEWYEGEVRRLGDV